MLCTVSCRAQPIHSFKLIIHLDDTVQRVITYISYISKCPANSHTYVSLFWLDFGMLLLKGFFYYLKEK